MPKLNNFNGEDRYNFMLALVAFLQNRGSVTLEEAAQHFGLEVKYIRKAVTSINEARATLQGFEEWFFLIDIEALEDYGVLALIDNSVIEDVPRLSNRQASAIAAGLSYLATIPGFKDDPELAKLQELLASGTSRGINPIIESRPGSAEAGAETISKAMLTGKQITCEYINQKGERSVRTIEPLRLDPRADGWYLRGYCPIHREVRNFKLDRMRGIEVSDSSMSPEAQEIEILEDSMYVAQATDTIVTVEVEPEGYRLISESKSISEPVSVAAGLVRADIKVGHLPNIGKLVARFGGAARVIAPEEARLIVKNYALAALGKDAHPSIENED
jgi:proteasome accessory factor C